MFLSVDQVQEASDSETGTMGEARYILLFIDDLAFTDHLDCFGGNKVEPIYLA